MYAPFSKSELQGQKDEDPGTGGIEESSLIRAIQMGLIAQRELEDGYVSIIKKSNLLKSRVFGPLQFEHRGQTHTISLESICYWISTNWLYDENLDILWSYETRSPLNFRREKILPFSLEIPNN